jgi:hypothetical protein
MTLITNATNYIVETRVVDFNPPEFFNIKTFALEEK